MIRHFRDEFTLLLFSFCRVHSYVYPLRIHYWSSSILKVIEGNEAREDMNEDPIPTTHISSSFSDIDFAC